LILATQPSCRSPLLSVCLPLHMHSLTSLLSLFVAKTPLSYEPSPNDPVIEIPASSLNHTYTSALNAMGLHPDLVTLVFDYWNPSRDITSLLGQSQPVTLLVGRKYDPCSSDCISYLQFHFAADKTTGKVHGLMVPPGHLCAMIDRLDVGGQWVPFIFPDSFTGGQLIQAFTQATGTERRVKMTSGWNDHEKKLRGNVRLTQQDFCNGDSINVYES